MRHRGLLIVVLVGIGVLLAGNRLIDAAPPAEVEADRLAVVWTSGDPDVAHRMVLMYTNASKRNGWFDEVRLVIWGPSQRLLVGDKDIQAYVARLQESGVVVQACQACSDSYGITDAIRALDIEVKYMGVPLTDFLKDSQWHVMTF
ncbi:MAG: DsrE family protein [Phycisphaeraceae bacterium]|nr:MAG: DsrE family protein [Phycisphaeraceae bacterium]